jgi:hypothetical protein
MMYWCFVTDNTGHWYKIPVSKKYDFEEYIHAMENDLIWDNDDFEKYRCMHPVNYMFKDIEVLKENKDFLDSLAEEPIKSDDPIIKPKLRKTKK